MIMSSGRVGLEAAHDGNRARHAVLVLNTPGARSAATRFRINGRVGRARAHRRVPLPLQTAFRDAHRADLPALEVGRRGPVREHGNAESASHHFQNRFRQQNRRRAFRLHAGRAQHLLEDRQLGFLDDA